MSKYTTELRYICEYLAGLDKSVGETDMMNVIELARTKIFDFDYKIFDTSYKKTLETNILMNYYFREIGYETYGLWKANLRRWMIINMPMYNKLYSAVNQEFNPLFTHDMTETVEGSVTYGSTTGNKSIYSDTPMGSLGDIFSEEYASSTSQSNTENGGQDTNKTTRVTQGKEGSQSYAAMLKEFKDSLYNVDILIIEELASLFIGVW